MNTEDIQQICNTLPFVSMEIKWKSDLVFMVGKKMFCIVDLDGAPTKVSFKVSDDDYQLLSQSPHFRPAPYFARYNWVMIDDSNKMSKKSWDRYLRLAYQIVFNNLPAKVKVQLVLQGR